MDIEELQELHRPWGDIEDTLRRDRANAYQGTSAQVDYCRVVLRNFRPRWAIEDSVAPAVTEAFRDFANVQHEASGLYYATALGSSFLRAEGKLAGEYASR